MMTKDEMGRSVVKQLQTSEEFRQPRLRELQENEDILALKTKPTLEGMYNVPFDGVVASSFVDTLVGQISKPPKILFNDPKGSNAKSVKKVQALWDRDSGITRQNWSKIDRLVKRLTAQSNIGIFEYIAQSNPYKGKLSVIDYYDFHCEPNGGTNLEEHLFKGVTNQFQTKTRIAELAKSGYYDSGQVEKLLNAYNNVDYKFNEEKYQNKSSRMASLGLDLDGHAYVGQSVFNLSRWVANFDGEDWYIVFDYRSGIWIKMDLLKNCFESGLSPWVVWNAVENPFTLWGPGLFDQMKPVAEAIRINLNEILNNVRKRNWDMKAVDGNIFQDISALNWRQDGIVKANVPLGQSIQNGIYRFETPDVSGSLNVVQYLNDFVGINTGISDQTKGDSAQDTLGVAKINELNLSKRMQLIGDSYSDAYTQIGLRYDWGLYEHCGSNEMIKIIGSSGAEMEAVKKEDLEPDYDIGVITRSDEMHETKIGLEQKGATLERLFNSPEIMAHLNMKWVAEQELRIGGWSEEDIRRAMDTKNDAFDEIVSAANKNIERIVEGKEPRKFQGATMGYLERIHRYINENDLKPETIARLQMHFDEHVPIARENEARNADIAVGSPLAKEPVSPDLKPMEPAMEPKISM